ncbi:MAG: hypothetical protein KBC84_04400, partial [Proteobacteria bacterium]|nr:hypothetical protein [Pseudomonadota bacterium]
MNRRNFIKLSAIGMLPIFSSSCGVLRIDPNHYLLRSPYIDSPEDEKRILSKAKLEWSEDGRIRVLHLSGNHYEMGYQHGALLREEVQKNMLFLYNHALEKFRFEELFAEIYERMRPYIPQEYIDEMQGLAHGSRLPLHVVHHIHILPELGEWSGKKRLKKVLDKMMAGDLAQTCSNFCLDNKATEDNEFYAIRILDWGMHRFSKLHEYPLITVCKPDKGIPYSNISWVGFVGAVSGMNAEGITLGEMGYGDPPNETLFGEPMPFMLRDILSKAKNLADVKNIIQNSKPTCSFVFLMSDGKTKESEIYVRDPDRFLVFKAGERLKDKKEDIPPINNILYGGHYNDRMTENLNKNNGKINLEMLQKELIPKFAMPSNFQNVIYKPAKLQFWVSNAKSKSEWAASQPYT